MSDIKLRPWTFEDTERLLEWLDEEPEMLDHINLASTPAQLINVISYAMQAQNCAIFAAENGEGLVGFLAATNAQADGSANCHIGVAPKHRGKGPAVMREGQRVAFEELGLRTLIAAVPKGREDIEKFDKRFGFVEPDAKILVLTRDRWEKRNGIS